MDRKDYFRQYSSEKTDTVRKTGPDTGMSRASRSQKVKWKYWLSMALANAYGASPHHRPSMNKRETERKQSV